MKSIAWITAALLVTASNVGAQVPTTVIGPSPHTERVSYHPADLSNEAGIRHLRGRVRSAAHRVCDPGYFGQVADWLEASCYQATLPDAMAQVDRAVARLAQGEVSASPQIAIAAR